MICKICNQDIPDNKISLHYWNKHKVKYSSIVEKEKSDEKIECGKNEERCEKSCERLSEDNSSNTTKDKEGREERRNIRRNSEATQQLRKEEIPARDASRIDRNWDNYQRVVNYTTDEIEGEVINEWL